VQKKQAEKNGFSLLQLKWPALLLVMITVVMAYGCVQVYRAQHAALTQQVIDGGISLGTVIAVQAAIPVLGEDWATLESFLGDAAIANSFHYVTVSDHAGVVRVASDRTLVGTSWNPEQEAPVIYAEQRIEVTDRGDVFNVSLPILFTDTVVGSVHLGVDTVRLNTALATTKRMLVQLGFAILLAVAAMLYIGNRLLAREHSPEAVLPTTEGDTDPVSSDDDNT
jgi:sensor histidine kinase regulating citrate/malate metabolism